MSRQPADVERIRRFIRALGQRVAGPGRVYLVGGASALLVGWRTTTVDIDLKLAPEPKGAFAAIAQLKTELDVNVELACPDQFIPEVPGWQKRSRFIETSGQVQFFHYDFVSQALAKLERAHDRDLRDVDQMFERDLVTSPALLKALRAIRDRLIRYPAIDGQTFCRRVEAYAASKVTP